MGSPNSSWVPFAGFALLVGLAVGFSGALLFVDRDASPSPPGPVPSNDESVAVLRDLVDEVRLLRASIDAGTSAVPAAPASERAAVGGPPTDRLERSIERLAEVLASPVSAVQGRRPEAQAQQNPIPPKATARLLALCALSEAERGQAYYFWRRLDFVEQFGSPDEVNITGDGGYNVQLVYRISDERQFTFSFANDLLYYIDCNE